MPRRTVNPFWIERIHVITENEPKLGPGPVRRRLESVGAEARRTDWPAERTIGRIQAEYRAMPTDERRQNAQFRWPASMEHGDLPWEASAIAMEALRHADQLMHERRVLRTSYVGRPLLSQIKWFWRVTLARPDAEVSKRWNWARALAAMGTGIAEGDVAWFEMQIAGCKLEEDRTWFGERPSSELSYAIKDPAQTFGAMLGWHFSQRKSDLPEKLEEEDRG